MIDVKTNFKNMYLDTQFNFCNEEETQNHLMECRSIIENCPELYNDVQLEYEDIYGSEDSQLRMVKLYSIILKTREKLLHFM